MDIRLKTGLKEDTTLPVVVKDNRVFIVSEDMETDITESLDNQSLICIRHTGKAVAVVNSNENVHISLYVQTHVHSEYSLLDGISKLSSIAEVSSGVTALTDHGNMFAPLLFQNAMKKKGKKPIFGFEAYTESINGEKDKNHLILLAKNEVGYRNLTILTSKSYENMYYKPHVSYLDLEKYHEGIICTSACLGGEVAKKIKSDYEGAKKVALFYKNLFKDDYYLEIQRHNIEGEDYINSLIIKLGKELGIKIVGANDSHYIRPEDAIAQETALCVFEKKTLNEPHFKFEGDGYYYLSDIDMINKFWDIPEAITSSVEIALKCNYEIKTGEYHLPKFKVPEGYKDEEEYFLHLVEEGFRERFYGTEKYTSKEYLDRLEYEEKIIIQMGFPAYFLIVWDYVNFAKSNNILVGPGRGSAAGSLVSYCLKITNLDPLEYGLLFERFLNPDRISMPDIDMDFEFKRRAEVINYTKGVYGEDCVCNISTFSTLKPKAAVKDCARVSGNTALGSTISALISDKAKGLKDAMELNPELMSLYGGDRNAKAIIDLALSLENNTRQTSTNACGVVITGEPIVNYVATSLMESSDAEYNNGEKFLTTQADKNIVEELGLIKMDFLGLRTLSVIEEGLYYANKDRKVSGLSPIVDYSSITTFDPYVYAEISEGKSFAVFQIESVGMRSFMQELFSDVKGKIKEIENKYNCTGYLDYFKGDEGVRKEYEEEMTLFGKELFSRIIAGVSLYRPGPIDYIPDYIKNMNNPGEITYEIKELEPILKETYGVIVYQEEVMRIVRELAGFTSGQSDTIRKAMGKKKKEILDEYENYFVYGSGNEIDSHMGTPFGIKGCVANNIPEGKAKELWERMKKFAEYAFNKSHAAVYSVITMTCAYLKHYHGAGYMTAIINTYIDSAEKTKGYINVANKMGIEILPPDINKSANEFVVENGKIRFGFGGIKGVSKSAKLITKEREENGDFTGIQDFANRTLKHKVNKKTLEALIYVGCFDSFGKTRNAMVSSLDKIVENAKRSMNDNPLQLNFFELDLIEGNMSATDDNIPDKDELPKKILLSKEFEIAGMYITESPLDQYLDILKNSNMPEIGLLSDDDKNKSRLTLCGLIKSVTTRITKKDGRTMATFTLEDKSGEISCVLFPDDYSTFSSLLNPNEVRVVVGEYTENDFGSQIICSSVKTMENYAKITGNKRYCICVNTKTMAEVNKLTELVETHKGTLPVFFQLAGKVYKVRSGAVESSTFFAMLQDEFGDKNVIYRAELGKK